VTLEHFLALAVIGFASYRLTRVVVEDSITASFRAWIWRRAYVPVGYDSRSDREVASRRDGYAGWAWEKAFQLVTCPFCTGWWLTIGLYVAWFGWPSRARDVVALAAAIGMQAFVSSRQGA
jgi:hypothetical protein